jgi:hypothetical protein
MFDFVTPLSPEGAHGACGRQGGMKPGYDQWPYRREV